MDCKRVLIDCTLGQGVEREEAAINSSLFMSPFTNKKVRLEAIFI